MFIDTAGFDDYTDLGENVLKTKGVVDKCDLAVVVVAADATYLEKENEWEESMKKWYETLKQKKIPTMFVVTKSDLFSKADKLVDFAERNESGSAIC